MNGKLAYDLIMNGTDFAFAGQDIVFGNNLILGASLWQNTETSFGFSQSEASVANLNVYSRGLSESEMVGLTSKGECLEGDLAGWSSSEWKVTGEVRTLATEELCQKNPSNLILLPFPLLWQDCVATCPRLATGGRLPQVDSLKEAENLLVSFNGMAERMEEGWVWAPWRLKMEEDFVDTYTGEPMLPGLWVTGQPNGGSGQQCSGWWKGTDEVGLSGVNKKPHFKKDFYPPLEGTYNT